MRWCRWHAQPLVPADLKYSVEYELQGQKAQPRDRGIQFILYQVLLLWISSTSNGNWGLAKAHIHTHSVHQIYSGLRAVWSATLVAVMTNHLLLFAWHGGLWGMWRVMFTHSGLKDTITPPELLFAAPLTETNSNGEQPLVANYDMKEGMGMGTGTGTQGRER